MPSRATVHQNQKGRAGEPRLREPVPDRGAAGVLRQVRAPAQRDARGRRVDSPHVSSRCQVASPSVTKQRPHADHGRARVRMYVWRRRTATARRHPTRALQSMRSGRTPARRGPRRAGKTSPALRGECDTHGAPINGPRHTSGFRFDESAITSATAAGRRVRPSRNGPLHGQRGRTARSAAAKAPTPSRHNRAHTIHDHDGRHSQRADHTRAATRTPRCRRPRKAGGDTVIQNSAPGPGTNARAGESTLPVEHQGTEKRPRSMATSVTTGLRSRGRASK